MRRLLVLALLAWLVDVPVAAAWTWPVDGPVLRPFAFGDDPYAAGQHRGVDIGGPDGGTIVAPAAGRVAFGGTVPHGGRTLTIETSDGYSVTLVHVGTLGAARGESVSEGQPVATLGPSGDVEWPQPYVHLGVRVTSDPQGYVDPLLLLPPRGASASGADAAPPRDDAQTVADAPPDLVEGAVPDAPEAARGDEAEPLVVAAETPVAQAATGDTGAEPVPAVPAERTPTVAVPTARSTAAGHAPVVAPVTETATAASTGPIAATPATEPAPPAVPTAAPPAVPVMTGSPAAEARAAPATPEPLPVQAAGEPETGSGSETPSEPAPTAGEPAPDPVVAAPRDMPAAADWAPAQTTVALGVAGPGLASAAEGLGRSRPHTSSPRSSESPFAAADQPVHRASAEPRRTSGESSRVVITRLGGSPGRRPMPVERPVRWGTPVGSGGDRAVSPSWFAAAALLVLATAMLAGAVRRRRTPVRVPRVTAAVPSCRFGARRRPLRPCRSGTTADVLVTRLFTPAPPRPGPSRPLAGRSGRALVAARRRRAFAARAL